jgi:hypothetical protein
MKQSMALGRIIIRNQNTLSMGIVTLLLLSRLYKLFSNSKENAVNFWIQSGLVIANSGSSPFQ